MKQKVKVKVIDGNGGGSLSIDFDVSCCVVAELDVVGSLVGIWFWLVSGFWFLVRLLSLPAVMDLCVCVYVQFLVLEAFQTVKVRIFRMNQSFFIRWG